MNEEDRDQESLEFSKHIYTYYEKKEEDQNLYSQYNKAKKCLYTTADDYIFD